MYDDVRWHLPPAVSFDMLCGVSSLAVYFPVHIYGFDGCRVNYYIEYENEINAASIAAAQQAAERFAERFAKSGLCQNGAIRRIESSKSGRKTVRVFVDFGSAEGVPEYDPYVRIVETFNGIAGIKSLTVNKEMY